MACKRDWWRELSSPLMCESCSSSFALDRSGCHVVSSLEPCLGPWIFAGPAVMQSCAVQPLYSSISTAGVSLFIMLSKAKGACQTPVVNIWIRLLRRFNAHPLQLHTIIAQLSCTLAPRPVLVFLFQKTFVLAVLISTSGIRLQLSFLKRTSSDLSSKARS